MLHNFNVINDHQTCDIYLFTSYVTYLNVLTCTRGFVSVVSRSSNDHSNSINSSLPLNIKQA